MGKAYLFEAVAYRSEFLGCFAALHRELNEELLILICEDLILRSVRLFNLTSYEKVYVSVYHRVRDQFV